MEREVKKESTMQPKNSEYSNISIDLQSQVLNNNNWSQITNFKNFKKKSENIALKINWKN